MEKNKLEIELSDLRKIINSIFDFTESVLGKKSIVLEEDMYWEILSDKLYSIDQDPELGIGQLYDDWEFLSSILEDEYDAVPPMFMHVAPILTYMAYRGNFFEKVKTEEKNSE